MVHQRDDELPYQLARAAGRCQFCREGGGQVTGARMPGDPGWWVAVICAGCLESVEPGAVVVTLVRAAGEPAPPGSAA
jgi:hypothetical protein